MPTIPFYLLFLAHNFPKQKTRPECMFVLVGALNRLSEEFILCLCLGRDACLSEAGAGPWRVAGSSEGENPAQQLVSLSLGCHGASLPACLFLGITLWVFVVASSCLSPANTGLLQAPSAVQLFFFGLRRAIWRFPG